MARRVVHTAAGEPRRRLVGIDLGLRCGYAVIDVGAGEPMTCVASGAWRFKNARDMGGGMLFIKFGQRFGSLLRQIKPAALGYEKVKFMHQGTARAQVYFGLEGQLTTKCEGMRIPFEGYSPGTIKKMAAGHGHASKELVQQTMDRLFCIETKCDNEADAVAAAVTLARTMGWDDDGSEAS